MLNSEELKRYLPQRFPMMMVDRVLDFEKGKSLKGLKNVSANEIYFLGHFPQQAIMPGAFVLEGLAQCSVILFQLTYGVMADDEVPVFGSVKARFLHPVFPGDQLIYEVEATKLTSSAGIFEGMAKVNNKAVAKCQLSMGKQSIGDLN
ncbi:MAG: 3-hydroxyacyl-ACP dehydratase FabZ [bacterium]